MNEVPSPEVVPSSQPQSLSAQVTPVPPQIMVCPQCHLPQSPEFYFCPNCGTKLRTPPLSTSVISQTLLYLFSAVLPWIAYLAITKWDGIKYMRSPDSQTRNIGYIALIILVVSSIIAFWLVGVWINQALSSVTSGLNGSNSILNGNSF